MFENAKTVTFGQVDGPCESVLIEGQLDNGAIVTCPDCGQPHELISVVHTAVMPTVQIGTIHIFE